MNAAYQSSLQAKQNAYQTLLVRAYTADEDSLRAALSSKNSSERLVATYVIGERQLVWSGDLIERLSDSNALVRQAARRSLIILGYLTQLAETDEHGRSLVTDFGPKLGADKAESEESAKKWAEWWGKHGGGGPKTRSILSTVRGDAAIDIEAARLSAALVFAPPERQGTELSKYVKEKGVVYTEALGNALPQLQGETLKAARDGLAQRLTRMTPETLRNRLGDPRGEVRRAAALAWASKEDRAAIPEIIPLLDDTDEVVPPAAKAALKALSGQDFGPARDATPVDRAKAVIAWKAWWQTQGR